MNHLFPNDPDIGCLEVITERIDQVTYIRLMKQLRSSKINWAIASTRGLGDWTWQDEPFLIEVISPRAVRKFNQLLRFNSPRISIAETRISEPDCDSTELLERIQQFLVQPCLPSFLRPMALGLDSSSITREDPYKLAEILLTAGLNERYIVEHLQYTP